MCDPDVAVCAFCAGRDAGETETPAINPYPLPDTPGEPYDTDYGMWQIGYEMGAAFRTGNFRVIDVRRPGEGERYLPPITAREQ